MFRIVHVGLLLCLAGAITAYAAEEGQAKVVKIRDFIYMAPMGSNAYMVTTPDGNVIIDTAPARQAHEAKQGCN